MMVFGAGTDVGKTIICAGLSMAALHANRRVCYIKPVQTGSLDEYFIQLYCNPRGISDIFVRTLHHWKINAAAHVANKAQRKSGAPISDQDLLSGIQREMKAFAEIEADVPAKQRKKPFIVVETAGGVLSPGESTLRCCCCCCSCHSRLSDFAVSLLQAQTGRYRPTCTARCACPSCWWPTAASAASPRR